MAGKCVRDNYHWRVIWGIILQCFSGLLLAPDHPLLVALGWLMLLTGTGLLLIGFAYYAKAKGRSPAWALLALVPIVGWLIVLSLAVKPASGQVGDGLAKEQ